MPGPVARPALVLDIKVNFERQIAAILVTYGTGNLEEQDVGGDLIIDDWEEVRELGLHKPTRFALSPRSRMLLPWCTEYFVPPFYVASAGIKIGSLTSEQIGRAMRAFAVRGLDPP